jgi:hypothetical protein
MFNVPRKVLFNMCPPQLGSSLQQSPRPLPQVPADTGAKAGAEGSGPGKSGTGSPAGARWLESKAGDLREAMVVAETGRRQTFPLR